MAFPTLFDRAQQIERQLGLNFWEEHPGCQKIRNSMCDPNGNSVLTLSYDLEQSWQAIDQRLKFSDWMQEFVVRGGELVIGAIALSHLEELTLSWWINGSVCLGAERSRACGIEQEYLAQKNATQAASSIRSENVLAA